jgi:hypothetical protein
MAVPFAGWTLREADARLAAVASAHLRTNRLFVDGDHWQNGQGWIGPSPQPGDQAFDEAMRELARAFTSRNATGEVVGRHGQALLGREPAFGLTVRRALAEGEEPTAQEQAKIDEAEAALTQWWDARGIAGTLTEAAQTVLWAAAPEGHGRAPLRLYVPRGYLKDGAMTVTGADGVARQVPVKVLVAKDLPEALGLLWLEAADPAAATVACDDDTKREVGVAKYADQLGDGAGFASGSAQTKVRVELCYLDESGKTVLRTMTQGDEASAPLAFDLGGRLTMFELRRPKVLITPQVQQQQRALNLAESMLPQNVITGGFLERLLFNCQLPGQWSAPEGDPTRRWIPEPFYTGPGTTNALQGVTTRDANGNEVVASPSAVFRPPIDTSPTIQAQDKHYATILQETDQAHVLMAGDAEASGEARKQARADFAASLRATQGTVEAAGRWVIETALAVAEAILGTPGQWTNELRAVFTCRLDLGPISADEQRANSELVEAGLLSDETAMSQNGIADVDAEKAKILSSPIGALKLSAKQAETYAAWINAGASNSAAALLAGLDEEQTAALLAPVDPTKETVVEP